MVYTGPCHLPGGSWGFLKITSHMQSTETVPQEKMDTSEDRLDGGKEEEDNDIRFCQ